VRSRSIIVAAVAAALAASAIPIAQASPGASGVRQASPDRAAVAATRQFEGRVTSVNRTRQTFRIRRANGARVRFQVDSRTRFERIAGFSALRRGLGVEVKARRAGGGWIARKVEPHGTNHR
jgi:hypothetical protein